ncbi:hypothetical protein B0T17DRAFT_539098 [Bombardia bombarda]|uniref:Uncharacterized protein n=1 Tax=Bombardia bombarda TaxID=252184 RepID=A0AA40BW56_9PEZI|nr:hypothetical protein B0T17DRAFT_539098 [Bombardia bombarda]
MKLTLIKPKGRGRKKRWQPPDPQRFRRKREEEAAEEEKELAAHQDGNSSHVHRRRRIKTRKPPALIEQLPAEILERIFLMSENLNFPKSSIRIGCSLSGQSFLSELVISAFAPTWDLWFGCPRSQIKSYVDYAKDDLRLGGSPGFQTAVLASRWANLPLILRAQKIWYFRHGAARYFQHTENWAYAFNVQNNLPLDMDEPLHAGGGFDHAAAEDAGACFDADWEQFKNSGSDTRAWLEYMAERKLGRTGYLEMHPSAQMPNHLIMGPYDWDKARWLYWFIRGGASLSATQTWELSKRGYENIMKLDDPELVFQLIRLFSLFGIFGQHWPRFLVVEKLEEAENNSQDMRMSVDSTQVWDFAQRVLLYHLESRSDDKR